VGPALRAHPCDAGLSFLGLLVFRSRNLSRAFGEAGFIFNPSSRWLTVLSLGPPCSACCWCAKRPLSRRPSRAPTRASTALPPGFRAWVALRMVVGLALTVSSASIVVCGFGAVYVGIGAQFRLADQVPDKEQAVQAGGRLDAKLPAPIRSDVLIKFPEGASLYAPQTLDAIAEVHQILEKQAGRRQRLVSGNVAPLARPETGQVGRRRR